MRSHWKLTWGASLGLLVAGARADDTKWTAAAPAPKGTVAAVKTTAAVATFGASSKPPAKLPIADAFVVPVGHSQPMSVAPPPSVQYLELPPNVDTPQPMPTNPTGTGDGSGSGSSSAQLPASPNGSGSKIEPVPMPRVLDSLPPGAVIMPPPGGPVYSSPLGSFPPGPGGPIHSIPEGDCTNGACLGGCGECGTQCGDCCDCCECGDCFGCSQHQFYASAEYLLWWIHPSSYPPLVTTAPNPAGPAAGIPGGGNSVTLIGGGNINLPAMSGMRANIGYWFDPEHTLGVEGGFFFIGPQSVTLTEGSNAMGSPFLARPFLDASRGGLPNAEFISVPGTIAGRANVNVNSDLWGAEASFRKNLYCCDWYHIDALAGFRYTGLDEGLNISEGINTLTTITVPFGSTFATVPAGTSFLVQDNFHTMNSFYGGQIGLSQEFRFLTRMFVDLNTKVAVGVTHQSVDINGNTTITLPGSDTTPPAGLTPGVPVTLRGGLLALPSNIGSYSSNAFSVVPEVGINLGVNINEHFRVFAGCTFLFWSDVVRPGEQVPTLIDSRQIPPPTIGPNGAQPSFTFKPVDFWAYGVNIGVEYRW